MESNDEKKWYALYTKPRAEKKLNKLLTLHGFDGYLPLVLTRRKWSDRTKLIELPLYASYIFVKINYFTDKKNILPLPGALHFVHVAGKPYEIDEEDIEVIKKMVDEFPDKVKVYKQENLKKGTKVLIRFGYFTGKHAEIERVKGGVNVIVKIPGINLISSVEIPIDNLGLDMIE